VLIDSYHRRPALVLAFLDVQAKNQCDFPTSVEDESWGKMKELYR
jgi:hypothetical protein